MIERTARGYRLALATTDVDAWALRPEGLRLAAAGDYAAALPLLERAESDDEVVAALLRAVAAVHGVPAALERYEPTGAARRPARRRSRARSSRRCTPSCWRATGRSARGCCTRRRG